MDRRKMIKLSEKNKTRKKEPYSESLVKAGGNITVIDNIEDIEEGYENFTKKLQSLGGQIYKVSGEQIEKNECKKFQIVVDHSKRQRSL